MLLRIWKTISTGWDNFFHRQVDLSIFGPIRIGFALLLLINMLLFAPELEKWFAEDGTMPFETSRMVIDENTYSVFQFLPKTDLVLWLSLIHI